MRLVESKRAESGEFRTMTPAFCPLLGLIYCTRSTALGLLFTNTCFHHVSEQRAWPITNKRPLRLIYMPTLVTALLSDCNCCAIALNAYFEISSNIVTNTCRKYSCIQVLFMIVMHNNNVTLREKIIEFKNSGKLLPSASQLCIVN